MARKGTLLVTVVAVVVVFSGASATVAATAGAEEPAAGTHHQIDETPTDDANETTQDNETDTEQPDNATVDLREVYQTHRTELLAEGYHATEQATILVNDTEFYSVHATTTATPDAEQMHLVANVTIAGKEANVSVWANESHTFYRKETADNVTYAVYPRGPPMDGPRGDGPPMDGPRGDGPPMDGPRGDGPPMDGPRGDGPPMDGPRGDGPPMDGPRGDGPPMDGPRGDMNPRSGSGSMGMHAGMHHGMMAEKVPGAALAFLEPYAGEFMVENATEEDVQRLAGGNVTVADNESAQLTSLEAPLAFDEFEGNATGSVAAVADESGVVHGAAVAVDSRVYASQGNYNLTVDQLGVDEIEQPGWVDEVPADAYYGPPN